MSVSQETLNFSYNFRCSIKSMAYFPHYIYLDPYHPLHNKLYSSKYTEIFEREIQLHEMVTQPPAMIFNQ